MQVNQIAAELTNPTYDYGAPGSMWELYQFATQTMKNTHPRFWMDTHMRTHKFFVNESGILVSNAVDAALEESPLHQTMQIMAAGGDGPETIEQFKQLTMEF
jgi:hypothetical protein